MSVVTQHWGGWENILLFMRNMGTSGQDSRVASIQYSPCSFVSHRTVLYLTMQFWYLTKQFLYLTMQFLYLKIQFCISPCSFCSSQSSFVSHH